AWRATDHFNDLAVRGDPGAVVVAMKPSGFRLPIDSTEWSLVTSMAALGDDILVGGSFGGTLRIADKVVSSAGGSDGFLARISSTGQLVWLIRCGGGGADAIQGVSTSGNRIAIAGTFTAGADLLGEPLKAYDERLPYADAFVAELDENGARRWQQTLGGKGDEAVAGVAIDANGRVVIAGSGREVIYVGNQHLVTAGDSDGFVAWYGPKGEPQHAMLLGGFDDDGIRSIAAVDDRVVIGGFFSGQLKLGDRTLEADGKTGAGYDAYLVAIDGNGIASSTWHVGGAGSEDIVGVTAIAGGFIAGISHTGAAKLDDATLAAPTDPASGAAIVLRGL
ncbi:MAG TPA: hypothetical protein VL326_08750, partial [Kofleriaceae bacterium]|nr:hypothetical protein [Kofleriaceae bacterium]